MKPARNVFISYRRAYEPKYAELLHARLESVLGRRNVFLDRKGIEGGDQFRQVLARKLRRCDTVIALVGPTWLSAVEDGGRRRLDNPDDVVRYEIASAMRQSKRVIPVLIGGAKMPAAADLPDELKEFANLNAKEIRHTDISTDIEVLAQIVQDVWERFPNIYALTRIARMKRVVSLVILAVILAEWVQLADHPFPLAGLRIETIIMTAGDSISERVSDRPLRVRPSEDVRMISIGDTAVKKFGPFDKNWRKHHSRLIEVLADAGASVIAFDLQFDDPNEEFDGQLAKAIQLARYKGTVVIFGLEKGFPRESPLLGVVETAHLCVGEHLSFAVAAPLLVTDGSGNHPSLALATVLQGREIRLVDEQLLRILAEPPAGRGGLESIGFGRYDRIPADKEEAVCLRAFSEKNSVLKVARQVVRFSPRSQLEQQMHRYEDVLTSTSEELSRAFLGKVVLVGREESLDKKKVYGEEIKRPGFLIHADSINTILHGVTVRPLDACIQISIIVLMGALGQSIVWSSLFMDRKKRLWVQVGMLFATTLVYWCLSVMLYVKMQLLSSPIYELGVFFLSYLTALLLARYIGLWNSIEN